MFFIVAIKELVILKYSLICDSLSSICFLSGYFVTLSHFNVEEFLLEVLEEEFGVRRPLAINKLMKTWLKQTMQLTVNEAVEILIVLFHWSVHHVVVVARVPPGISYEVGVIWMMHIRRLRNIPETRSFTRSNFNTFIFRKRDHSPVFTTNLI